MEDEAFQELLEIQEALKNEDITIKHEGHCSTVTGTKAFSCSHCDKVFYHRSSYSNHIKIHGRVRKNFECSTCDKNYPMMSLLKSHEKHHSTERPFRCTWCDKTFKFFDKLKIHERVHTGETPFACSKCDKKFTSSG